MRDEFLLAKIKQGNAQAFKVFFDKHYRPLCIYLSTFTPDMDTAKELAQDVFVDFWNKREAIVVKTSEKSYLFRMGYHLFLNRKRQRNKQNELLEELKHQALEEELERPEDTLKEATQKLSLIIKTLPPKCQEILKLRMQGYKYKEIAENLDVSIKTVETQMRIAYIKIREGFGGALFLMFSLKT